jgi:aldehyde:ferredoxin oxidoreductase
MMKIVGYDQILINGRARTPVYLKIIDEYIEVSHADDLWGKKTSMKPMRN